MVFETITAVTSIVTAVTSSITLVGLGYAKKQLRLAADQNRTNFEDGLAREFRDLIKDLPVRVMLGADLSDDQVGEEQTLTTFYHYFDLTNYQVFLRSKRRISDDAWLEWRQGIQAVCTLPAFERAWRLIRERRPNLFADLSKLRDSEFKADPTNFR